MTFTRHITTALAVIVAASTALGAQNAQAVAASTDQSSPVAATVEQPATTVAAAQPVSFAPFAANSQVGVHALAPSAPAPYEPEHEHLRHSEAMMIVGGAILIVGAVVGGTPGTIIMIGGGTIGILGLIRYLQ
jgi:hypothetical protein